MAVINNDFTFHMVSTLDMCNGESCSLFRLYAQPFVLLHALEEQSADLVSCIEQIPYEMD